MGEKEKILIIDDHRDAILRYAILLHEKGYLIGYAENGEKALSWIRDRGNPDLVILDLGEDQLKKDPERYSLSKRLREDIPEVKIVGWTFGEVKNEHRSHYDRTFEKMRGEDEKDLEKMVEELLKI